MLEAKRVAVVVPAHNEAELIVGDAAGHPGVRRPRLRRRRRLDRRDGGARAVGRRPADRGDGARAEPRRRRGDRHRLQARARRSRRRDRGDGRRQPDGSRRARGAVAAGRARRARLREGEPALHRQRVDADPAQPVPRQRGTELPDEDRVRLLARRRLTGRLHGALASDAAAARPRPHLHVVRLPERHARAPERVERARARLPVAADLRRRRAIGDQDPRASSRASRGCSGRASSGGSARST